MVGDPSNSFIWRWAKPTTATFRMAAPSEVLLVGVELRIRLTGGFEVTDVLDRGAPLLLGTPHRPDPHAHSDLGGIHPEDQVEEGDVRAVEQHVRRHVGRGDLLDRKSTRLNSSH